MQSYDIPHEHAAEFLAEAERKARLERINQPHHMKLIDGGIRVTDIACGNSDKAIHDHFDRELRRAEQQYGATNAFRAKIGRNSPCPCKSGRKFKKCCMEGTRVIGTT